MFLDVISSCNDIALEGILRVTKNILTLIQILGPILCIVSLTYTFIQLGKNPENKKLAPRLKNSAIALVTLFFIPILINAIFGVLGESTDFSSCWNNISSTYNSVSSYDGDDVEDRVKVYTDPSQYEGGVENSSDNSSSSTKQSTSSTKQSSKSKIVFLGDSRTVQMYAYSTGDWSGANYSSGGVHVVGSDIYVAEGAKGLAWLKSTGVPAAKKYFTKDAAIVILMGVNDLDNTDSYINYVNSNASSWKANGSTLYYVSVNPCSGNYSSLNSKIESFNSKVKSGLDDSVGWIDTYSVLKSKGFTATDGVHYNKSTYQMIYDTIKSKV